MIFVVSCVFRVKTDLEVPFGNHILHCVNPECSYCGKEVTYFICDKCTCSKSPATKPKPEPRPDLKAIALTLPVESPEKIADRTFKPPIFHDDGSIEYPKGEKDWEPPKDINGYARDPDNKWLFHPQWPVCSLRYMAAFLKANCGCIDIIARCNNPKASMFGQRIGPETCIKCPVRII